MAGHLREFLAMANERGHWTETRDALSIKHDSGQSNPFNFGYVNRSLWVELGPASWFGRLDEGRRYCEKIAGATGGFVRAVRDGTECTLRLGSPERPRTPRLSDLLPQHRDLWLSAMDEYVAAFARQED
jgi:hypothetical protein